MHLPKIKQDNSLSETVYQAVYRQILTGGLKPGQRITEQAIAQGMAISRAPIREALKRLAEDHLVRLVPRSGCFVANPSRQEIDEIYEIRKRLETMALEYAFDRLDPARVRKLRCRLVDCDQPDSAGFVARAVKLDNQFHTIILKDSQCPNLQEMLEKLRARVEVFRVSEANVTERARDALQEHIAILDAILAGDKRIAIDRLQSHIEHTKNNVLSSADGSAEAS